MTSPAHDKAIAVAGGLDITVVTPRGRVAHRAVGEITARGTKGEFGVLPGHIPILTMLDTGVLILDGVGGRAVYAHGPGYLEVGANGKVEVLVEQTMPAASVDVAAAKTELETSEVEMKNIGATDDAGWKNLRARRAWALAQLEAHARA